MSAFPSPKFYCPVAVSIKIYFLLLFAVNIQQCLCLKSPLKFFNGPHILACPAATMTNLEILHFKC
jgi:hypothetical protein